MNSSIKASILLALLIGIENSMSDQSSSCDIVSTPKIIDSVNCVLAKYGEKDALSQISNAIRNMVETKYDFVDDITKNKILDPKKSCCHHYYSNCVSVKTVSKLF